MAVATIAHKPEMTKEQLQEIFAKHFEGTYDVHEFRGFGRDFVIAKNPWVGIAVKLEQSEGQTKLNYNGICPAWWARAMLGVLFGLFLWNGITDEVKEFIATAPQFQ